MKVHMYSEWRQTNITLHMILQMMGKTKLDKMVPQPEWNHSLLDLTSDGFTTGLIPNGEHSFEVRLNLMEMSIEAKCTSGLCAGFRLNNKSVAEYYQKYLTMLDSINHTVTINPIPQEVFFTTPFNEQTNEVNLDIEKIRDYFSLCVFARSALLHFSSCYRGKKILPAMFWGTFDMTTVLFSGINKTFPGEGIVEKVAFNEQFVEFGFWPGDEKTDEPFFFILAYPFIEQDMDMENISPKEAFYSAEKKEYFLSVKDALKYDNPLDVVAKFCESCFIKIAKKENWENIDWLLNPFNLSEFK